MKQVFFILTVILFSCSAKQEPDKDTDALQTQATASSKYLLTAKNSCEQKALSDQFDIIIDFQRFSDTIEQQDSSLLKVYLKDKVSKKILDSILCKPFPIFDCYYSSCDSMTSYTTGFNSTREIVDNYFGDIVVADLNFDGNDDIALINDIGGNGGPAYFYYTQTNTKKFILDTFLTDSVIYFPTKIDKAKKRLITYVHAGACCLGKHTYQFNNTTNTWKQTSHKILGK